MSSILHIESSAIRIPVPGAKHPPLELLLLLDERDEEEEEEEDEEELDPVTFLYFSITEAT